MGPLTPSWHAAPGEPLTDIAVTEQVRFVMKGGEVFRYDAVPVG